MLRSTCTISIHWQNVLMLSILQSQYRYQYQYYRKTSASYLVLYWFGKTVLAHPYQSVVLRPEWAAYSNTVVNSSKIPRQSHDKDIIRMNDSIDKLKLVYIKEGNSRTFQGTFFGTNNPFSSLMIIQSILLLHLEKVCLLEFFQNSLFFFPFPAIDTWRTDTPQLDIEKKRII